MGLSSRHQHRSRLWAIQPMAAYYSITIRRNSQWMRRVTQRMWTRWRAHLRTFQVSCKTASFVSPSSPVTLARASTPTLSAMSRIIGACACQQHHFLRNFKQWVRKTFHSHKHLLLSRRCGPTGCRRCDRGLIQIVWVGVKKVRGQLARSSLLPPLRTSSNSRGHIW